MPMFTGELALTMDVGHGLTSGDGSDPKIRLDWSDDNGMTWGSEYSRSYGKRGQYYVVPTWRRMGRFSQNRVLRFTTTEPVKSNIVKLEAEIEEGHQ